MIAVEVVRDAISPAGCRITTFKLRYPRIVHAEFMTHRILSRNASGSRAVPTARLIEEANSDEFRAKPVAWGLNQKGMQAGEEHPDVKFCEVAWQQAAFAACEQAEFMLSMGLHKQIVNRVLEPFVHINVVVTATEWMNYFGLRLHKDADPTIRALTEAMWYEYRESTPVLMRPGEWYLPFVDAGSPIPNVGYVGEDSLMLARAEEDLRVDYTDLARRVSVARCARVSYESFETKKRSTVEEDLKLYDKLVGAQPIHASPAEHQATPDAEAYYVDLKRGKILLSPNRHLWGNFEGWIQFRKMLPGEDCAPLPVEYQ